MHELARGHDDIQQRKKETKTMILLFGPIVRVADARATVTMGAAQTECEGGEWSGVLR
jgi:hypothetical protein